MSSHRGQATIEYVGAILLVAVIVAAAAVAVAAPGIPRTIVAKLRLGLCIVGADVCSDADAAARGLEPCLLAGEEHTTANGMSIAVFRLGGTDFWTVERHSDGTVVLSQGYGQDGQVSTGFGWDWGEQVHAGGSASAGLGFRKGKSWTLTEAKLRQVLAATKGKPGWTVGLLLGEPDATFLEGGGSGSADLAVQAIKELPGAGGEARGVLGRRKDRDGTTYYVDLGGDSSGPITDLVPETDLHGHVGAEYRASDPPVITLRAAGRGRDGEETETVMRLALRTAEDRAAARAVAFVALSNPAFAVRDLIARIQARGTVERLRYRTREESHSESYGAKLGLELGFDHATSTLSRELVDAEVLNGAFPARREDCLDFADAAA